MVEVTNYFAVPHTELRQINLAYLVTNAHVKFFCFSLETINKIMAVTAECKKKCPSFQPFCWFNPLFEY